MKKSRGLRPIRSRIVPLVADSSRVTPPIVLVGNDALQRVMEDAERYAGRKERGGILLGLRRGPHLDINEATLPMLWDRGSMFSFKRSSAGHRAVALRRWRKSHHIIDWLGEWHSHPERHPVPSSIDLRSWREITRHRGAPMVFLIVGYEGVWLGLSYPGRASPIRYAEAERSSAGMAFLPAAPV